MIEENRVPESIITMQEELKNELNKIREEMNNNFINLNSRIDEIENNINDIKQKLSKLNNKTNEGFDALRKRLKEMKVISRNRYLAFVDDLESIRKSLNNIEANTSAYSKDMKKIRALRRLK
ncbi:MAG TPA: hypothetical protein VIK77_07265 [Tissierellaceae bacterium]